MELQTEKDMGLELCLWLLMVSTYLCPSSPSTNNVAEYEACLLGLNALAELGVRAVEVYGDSFLVIAQTQGKWKTKDETLLMYQALLDRTIACFDELTFSYIPRNQNHFADALASYVDMPDQTKIMPIIVQQKFEPSHCSRGSCGR